MLRFIRRLNYRDRVLETLGALLIAYPRGRQFRTDFPGIGETIRADFDRGTPAQIAALRLAETIVATLVRQLDPNARVAASQALRNFAPSQLEAIAAERLAHRSASVRSGATFLAELAGVALYMAGRMHDEGTLGSAELAAFRATIQAAVASDTPNVGNETGGDLSPPAVSLAKGS